MKRHRIDGESDRSDADAEAEEKTLYVGPTQVDCVGVAPQLCLLVKESPEADYTYFYGRIDGFTFVPGYEYELLVRVTPVKNAPADASSLAYSLVEEISLTEVGPTLENSAWQLSGMLDLDGAPVAELSGDSITASFSDGVVSGSGGCNSYSLPYTVEGNMLTVEPGAVTIMACLEPIASQEQLYLENLTAVTRYAIVDNELRLFGAIARPVLSYRLRKRATLAGVTWVVVGVNNGTGGVTSVINASVLTARFDDEGNVQGNGGCNDYGATYTADGESLTIGPVRSTRKACPQPDGVMAQEQAYFQALSNVAVYSIDGHRLQLRDANGALQVDYRMQTADA